MTQGLPCYHPGLRELSSIKRVVSHLRGEQSAAVISLLIRLIISRQGRLSLKEITIFLYLKHQSRNTKQKKGSFLKAMSLSFQILCHCSSLEGSIFMHHKQSQKNRLCNLAGCFYPCHTHSPCSGTISPSKHDFLI